MSRRRSRSARPRIVPDGPVIRSAVPDDGAAVVAMARSLSQGNGGRASRLSLETFRRDGFGADAAFSTLVAEHDGALVGYAVYCPGYDTDSATRGVYLSDLYVREEFRRLGIGRALLRGVAARMRARGARWMFWSVLKRNRDARRFYRTLAQELGDVRLCAAFGRRFDALAAAAAGAQDAFKRPD